MINKLLPVTGLILKANPSACGDKGTGDFLNDVKSRICKGRLDFNKFNTESWVRARRKWLEKNPSFDKRTKRTKDAARMVASEMIEV